jgi:hypothetical protein
VQEFFARGKRPGAGVDGLINTRQAGQHRCRVAQHQWLIRLALQCLVEMLESLFRAVHVGQHQAVTVLHAHAARIDIARRCKHVACFGQPTRILQGVAIFDQHIERAWLSRARLFEGGQRLGQATGCRVRLAGLENAFKGRDVGQV